MEIRLHNSLTRKKEVFEPLKKGEVSMYHCGPTVYDTPHVGNYRTFIMNDLLRRMFEYNGYTVTQVMNITDVEDKIIRKSREENISPKKLTEKYEKLFIEDITSLHILPPHHLVRATDHISSMISLISTLLEKGVAYKADDGVYLSIEKVNGYGKLANLDLSTLSPDNHSHERVANDEYDKDNPRDFAVWKFRTAEDGDTFWKTPFGEGRPGWHIECSAMSMEVLGPTIDVHTGGQDLIFPHHTNEIAQSESTTGKPFVQYWVHGGFMSMNDEKMAKSKGNVIKLETLSEESISPLAFRYWLMTGHYRSPLNFTFEAVRAAQTALIRLIATVRDLPEGGRVNDSYKEKFTASINDDLEMPKAVALIWELLKDANASDADKRATILDFDRVLGLDLASLPPSSNEPVEIPEEIQALAEAREEARKEKDWVKADALRAEIDARGYEISDTSQGIRISEKA
jgi:cysteinyl-tRNA synthetase